MMRAGYEPVGIAPGAELHGCGGATPFAPFRGGGSSGDQSKWAPGGQWTSRTGMPPPATPELEASAAPTDGETDAPQGRIVPTGGAVENGPGYEPIGVAPGAELHGCGGATPFAPFRGGGSSGDQSKWAPGGQWQHSAACESRDARSSLGAVCRHV